MAAPPEATLEAELIVGRRRARIARYLVAAGILVGGLVALGLRLRRR